MTTYPLPFTENVPLAYTANDTLYFPITEGLDGMVRCDSVQCIRVGENRFDVGFNFDYAQITVIVDYSDQEMYGYTISSELRELIEADPYASIVLESAPISLKIKNILNVPQTINQMRFGVSPILPNGGGGSWEAS